MGGPTDIQNDLDTAFPKPDSVLELYMPREYVKAKEKYFLWKENLYEDTGLKLAFGYQTLYQRASSTRTGRQNAFAGWAQLEGKWDAINRGEDYQGGLVFDLDWRHTLGGNANPVLFGVTEVGSLWGTDIGFIEFDPSLVALFWDQWLEMGRFNMRLGKQLAAATYDFFRFKDGRTSFTATPFTAHTSIPAPAFGQGASFKFWPEKESSLYVLGTLNDMNGDPESLGLDTFFEKRQYFYGLEVGYFWKRSPEDFDHLHLDLFYADERDEPRPGFPNEPGGGFKLLGSKQWGRRVGFSSYTYNTAQGGGLGLTFGKHTVTAGAASLKPLGIRGEVGLGATWMDPVDSALRDQYGGEVYWKLLLTPDLWVTPGAQVIFDPAFNPGEDVVAIAQIKARLFL